jgi:hypothetical protein
MMQQAEADKSSANGRSDALKKAVEARMRMKTSPNARAREKRLLALKWVHAWGLSSSKILREVVGAKNPSFITAMVKREGLLEAQSVLGRTFYIITRQGLQALCDSLPSDSPYFALDRQRTASVWAFEHNELAQRRLAALFARHRADVIEFYSERGMRSLLGTEKDRKVPDAALYMAEGRRIYIEIERTKKSGFELQTMMRNMIQLVARRRGNTAELWTRTKSAKSSYIEVLEREDSEGVLMARRKDEYNHEELYQVELSDRERRAIDSIEILSM